jgi:molybdopterin-guanine dinucleotide biosynthesis protein A
MTERRGWDFDDETLMAVPTDRAVLQQELDNADQITRIFYLRLLNRIDDAFAEGIAALADPAVAEDPWRALLMHADTLAMLAEPDFAEAERLQHRSWRFARSRSRQGTTMQHIGRRLFRSGELDEAAQFFQLALALRRGFEDAELVQSSELALERVRQLLRYGVIILAGGQGRRVGTRAKPELRVGGWPLIDHVLLAVSGARVRVVVGPPRIGLGDPLFCTEDPPGSGPVIAIDTGIDTLLRASPLPHIYVLAADLPFIAGGLVELRTTLNLEDNCAAAFVDIDGRVNYLASMWKTGILMSSMLNVGDRNGAPVRALFDQFKTGLIPDFDAVSADCDTPNDLAAAQERIMRHNPGQLPVTPLAWPRLELHAPS